MVAYITSAQDKQERVGEIQVTNFQNISLEWAVPEALATQQMNQRAEGDRTYHLLISFAPGETPSATALRDIETRMCAAIGYAEHQRVSAVHHDTDKVHIHIAINKIHPERHTFHEPYYDYTARSKMCSLLEIEHGLQRTNHEGRKRGSENRADDMERHAGVESLLGWIKRECADQFQNAHSWAEMHDAMRRNGLSLQTRANGLVITDGKGIGVKASSVARELSKAQLEKRLGAFETPMPRLPPARTESPHKRPKIAKAGAKPPPASKGRLRPMSSIEGIQIDRGSYYSGRPLHGSKINTVELYARYKAGQDGRTASRAAEWRVAQAAKARGIEAAKRKGRLKRAAIGLMRGAGVNKKALYSLTSKAVLTEIKATNEAYLRERQEIAERFQRRAWADWLKVEAQRGSKDALEALRAREARQPLAGDHIKGTGKPKRPGPMPLKPDGITKTGTIIYRVGESAIRDDGDSFKVSRGSNEAGLEAALRMAMHRYGECVTVTGSNEFKERMVRVAANAEINVTFDDAALEARREALVRAVNPKEHKNERRTNAGTRARADGGRKAGRTDGAVRTNLDGGRGTARAGWSTEPGSRAGAVRSAEDRKSDIGRVGSCPPPFARNRLRKLSELGVVRIDNGSEVLLPGHVHHNVEQQGTQHFDGVRRNVRGTGRVETAKKQPSNPPSNPPKTVPAVEKYVEERQKKRLKGFDIPNNRGYNRHDKGASAFAGLRQVEGETLALLKRNEEIIVLPVDAATARRMRRLSLGDEVIVTEKGAVRTKGRSR